MKKHIKVLAGINAGINAIEMVLILLFIGYDIIWSIQMMQNNSFKEIIATVCSLLFQIWACIGGLRGIKKAYKLAGKKGYVSELINCNICILFFEFMWWLVATVYSIFDNDFQITINKFIVIKIILVCIMAINTIIIYLSARNMNSNTMEKNEINEVNKENNY